MTIPSNQASQTIITRYTNGDTTRIEDALAIEAPLEIQIMRKNKMAQTLTITMRTPGNDAELAVGFMFAEGILQNKEQVLQSFQTSLERLIVMLAEDVSLDEDTLDRNFMTNSSCGVCGKNSLDFMDVKSIFSPAASKFTVSPRVLGGLPEKLFSAQSLFAQTGGNHAAAIFDTQGNLRAVREDVGRHNALDKVLGWALLSEQMPLSEHILLVSGRASYELVQKASMAGIGFMAAVGAPSSLAVDLAEKTGMTLLGFLKKERFNIYTHPESVA